MTIILNPVAQPRTASGATMPLIDNFAGKTIGILSNHWKSMDRMAARIASQLKDVYHAADVRFYDVPINGAMSAAVKAAAIADCDAAIVGLAN
jgi:hypothetical protein